MKADESRADCKNVKGAYCISKPDQTINDNFNNANLLQDELRRHRLPSSLVSLSIYFPANCKIVDRFQKKKIGLPYDDRLTKTGKVYVHHSKVQTSCYGHPCWLVYIMCQPNQFFGSGLQCCS